MSAFNLPPGCLHPPGDDPNECPTCEGNGEIENEEHDSNDPESKRKIDCPDCSGLGVINKRVKQREAE